MQRIQLNQTKDIKRKSLRYFVTGIKKIIKSKILNYRIDIDLKALFIAYKNDLIEVEKLSW
jgi:hypothetical protein